MLLIPSTRITVAAQPSCALRQPRAVAARAGALPLSDAGSTTTVSALPRRAVLLAATAPLLLRVAPGAAATAVKAPGVGDVAPTFTLPSTKGTDVSLSSVIGAGKWLVLYFYNADGTTGCSLEAQRFQQALPAIEALNATLIGVSMDSLSKHTEFCSDKKLSFTLLSDTDGSVSEAYGADLRIPILGRFSDRQTFLVDPKGVIRAKWEERTGSMASVKTPEHAQQVIDSLKSLQA
jgi:thioredoxin-dependent peroxiredoxin